MVATSLMTSKMYKQSISTSSTNSFIPLKDHIDPRRVEKILDDIYEFKKQTNKKFEDLSKKIDETNEKIDYVRNLIFFLCLVLF
jgi:peptidoglycan hydrolase CwlO-like protein